MKKIFLTFAALLTMTVVMAQPQDKERKAPKQLTPQQQTEQMATRLNLSADQKAKVLKLNTEYKDYINGPGMGGGQRPPRPNDANTGASEQQRPERPQMSDSQKKQMKQHMEKREEYNSKLKAILSDTQYKQYEESQPFRGQGKKSKKSKKN